MNKKNYRHKNSSHRNFSRSDRIEEQIKRDLSQIIFRELKNPNVKLISLTAVEITPDYAHAKIFFTTFDDTSEQIEIVQNALNQAAGFLRKELGKGLHLHTLPSLHFVFDNSLLQGQEMDKVIQKAMEKTNQSQNEENSE